MTIMDRRHVDLRPASEKIAEQVRWLIQHRDNALLAAEAPAYITGLVEELERRLADYEGGAHRLYFYPSVWGGLCVRLENGYYNGHGPKASQPLYTRKSEAPILLDKADPTQPPRGSGE